MDHLLGFINANLLVCIYRISSSGDHPSICNRPSDCNRIVQIHHAIVTALQLVTAEVGGTIIIINKLCATTEATRKLPLFAFLDEQDKDELEQMVAHVRMRAVLPV